MGITAVSVGCESVTRICRNTVGLLTWHWYAVSLAAQGPSVTRRKRTQFIPFIRFSGWGGFDSNTVSNRREDAGPKIRERYEG